MTMGGPNGAPINDRGKDMAVWEKQSDGTWKMVADTLQFGSASPIGHKPVIIDTEILSVRLVNVKLCPVIPR
jgi:hypothetical protein